MLASQSLGVLGRGDEARRLNLEAIRRAERRLELDLSDIRALSFGSNALFEAGGRDRALAWSAPVADCAILAYLICQEDFE